MMNAGQQLAAPIIADNLCIYGRNSKKKRKSRKKKIINHSLENYVNGLNFENRRKIKSSEEWIFTFQENVFLPGRTILHHSAVGEIINSSAPSIIQLYSWWDSIITCWQLNFDVMIKVGKIKYSCEPVEHDRHDKPLIFLFLTPCSCTMTAEWANTGGHFLILVIEKNEGSGICYSSLEN